MRQRTVANMETSEVIVRTWMAKSGTLPDLVEAIALALDEKEGVSTLALRDRIEVLERDVKGLRDFVKARNDGMLAPNPPRVVTLGNLWADDPDPGCEKGPSK